MKPSLRRDSRDIERAARQEAWILLTNSGKGNRATKPCREQLDDWQKVIVRFAQRHGAKVRRECAELALGYTKGDRQLYELILTGKS